MYKHLAWCLAVNEKQLMNIQSCHFLTKPGFSLGPSAMQVTLEELDSTGIFEYLLCAQPHAGDTMRTTVEIYKGGANLRDLFWWNISSFFQRAPSDSQVKRPKALPSIAQKGVYIHGLCNQADIHFLPLPLDCGVTLAKHTISQCLRASSVKCVSSLHPSPCCSYQQRFVIIALCSCLFNEMKKMLQRYKITDTLISLIFIDKYYIYQCSLFLCVDLNYCIVSFHFSLTDSLCHIFFSTLLKN